MSQLDRQLKFVALVSAVIAAGTLSSQAKPSKHSSAVSPVARQQQIANGRKLFDTLECSKCHSVAGQGGCLAPPLDDVTQRRSDSYLMLRLGEGEEDAFIDKMGHPELMPHPRFNKQHLRDVIAYLHTLKPAGTRVKSSASKSKSAAAAKTAAGKGN